MQGAAFTFTFDLLRCSHTRPRHTAAAAAALWCTPTSRALAIKKPSIVLAHKHPSSSSSGAMQTQAALCTHPLAMRIEGLDTRGFNMSIVEKGYEKTYTRMCSQKSTGGMNACVSIAKSLMANYTVEFDAQEDACRR